MSDVSKLLAELLLRRKELNQKVDQLKAINMEGLFELKVKRVNVTDNIDEVTAGVPKIMLAEVTAEYDFYAHALRLVDAAIQQANWNTIVDVPDYTMAPFSGVTSTAKTV